MPVYILHYHRYWLLLVLAVFSSCCHCTHTINNCLTSANFFFFFVKFSKFLFSISSKLIFLLVSSANKERISSFLCKISSNRLFVVFSFLNILKMGTKKHLLRCLTNKFMLYYFRYSTPIW